MNRKNSNYSRDKLVQEMMETPENIRRIDPKAVLGIDLDKPERARKVGNIYQGN